MGSSYSTERPSSRPKASRVRTVKVDKEATQGLPQAVASLQQAGLLSAHSVPTVALCYQVSDFSKEARNSESRGKFLDSN